MDKRPRKELIDGLRDSLRNFEERYDQREWRHFQRHRKSKVRKTIPLFLKLTGIAASLLLVVYASVRFLPLFDRVDEAGESIPKTAPHPSRGKEPEALDTLTIDSVTQAVEPGAGTTASASDARAGSSRLADLIKEEEASTHEKIGSQKVATLTKKTDSMTDSITINRPLKTGSLKVAPLATEFGNDRKSSHRKPDRSLRINVPKFRPLVGINLAPAFTNKGFSIGGGVSAQIPLSSDISAEIGVSYMNLKVGMNRKADRTDTVSLQTVGIRNSVGMVAVPVSLNYAVTESFSATLGLMPFRVVRNRRTDIHQTYRWVSGGVISGDTSRRLISEKTRSKHADSSYMGNTYFGFIQVSGQYSPPFLQKRNVFISPFVAVPIGRLRDDKYRWLHGGVAIRLYLR